MLNPADELTAGAVLYESQRFGIVVGTEALLLPVFRHGGRDWEMEVIPIAEIETARVEKTKGHGATLYLVLAFVAAIIAICNTAQRLIAGISCIALLFVWLSEFYKQKRRIEFHIALTVQGRQRIVQRTSDDRDELVRIVTAIAGARRGA